MGDIHHQEIHMQRFYTINSNPRMTLQSRDFMDRHSIDEVGLACLQRREARRIFGNLPDDDFFDRCFAAPIVVVASEHQITAALETDEFIRAGADWVLKPLITVLVRGYLAANESVA